MTHAETMEGITNIGANKERGTNGTVKKIPGPHHATAKEDASILTQLRTGHAPLAKHLFCIGKVNSPICPECQQSEEPVYLQVIEV